MPIDHRAVIDNPELLRPHCSVHPLAVLMGSVVLERGASVMPHAVVGKPTRGAGTLARTPDRNVEDETVIGECATIDCHAVVYAGVRIGPHSIVGAHASVREGSVVGSRCVIGHYADVSHDCVISDGVRVMNHATVIGGTIIGEGAFIGPGVTMANDSDLDAIVAGRWSATRCDPPIIGARAFIGCGSVILSGVRIGEGARVCAGAVVTKDVDPGETVLGLPARPRSPRPVNDAFAPITRFSPEDVEGDMAVFGHPV